MTRPVPGTALAGSHLRSLFSSTVAGTVGLEEEIVLVSRETWLPAPVADVIVAGVGDLRVKPELRVLDVQPTIARTGAIAKLVHALGARLAELYHLGELQPPNHTRQAAWTAPERWWRTRW